MEYSIEQILDYKNKLYSPWGGYNFHDFQYQRYFRGVNVGGSVIPAINRQVALEIINYWNSKTTDWHYVLEA